MSINKKITIAIILLVIEIAVIIFAGVFVQNHSLSIKYNDNKILGKTPQEIVDKYGLFDMAEDFSLENAVSKEAVPSIAGYYMRGELDSSKRFYVIVFDENGVAESISGYSTFTPPKAESLSQWTK